MIGTPLRISLCVLIAGIGAVACGPGPQSARSTSLEGDRPAFLYTLYSAEGEILLQLLILKPYGTGPGYNGSRFSTGPVETSVEIAWNQPDGSKKQFRFTYSDNSDFPLHIANGRWNTTPHNVFVVRLDDSWKPSVSPMELKATGHVSNLVEIQDALPDDKDVRSLRPPSYP